MWNDCLVIVYVTAPVYGVPDEKTSIVQVPGTALCTSTWPKPPAAPCGRDCEVIWPVGLNSDSRSVDDGCDAVSHAKLATMRSAPAGTMNGTTCTSGSTAPVW